MQVYTCIALLISSKIKFKDTQEET